MEKNKLNQIMFILSGAFVCLVVVMVVIMIEPPLANPVPTPVRPAENGANTPIIIVVTPEGSPLPSPTPTAGITEVALKLNPQIVFVMDEEEMILSVNAQNTAGEEVIGNMDFSGFSYKNAVYIVVNRLVTMGYISTELVNERVELSVASEYGNMDALRTVSSAISAVSAQFYLEGIVTEDEDARVIEMAFEVQKVTIPQPTVPQPVVALADIDTFEIEYTLTGYRNTSKDVGYKQIETVDEENRLITSRIRHRGEVEIDKLHYTINGKRYDDSQIMSGWDFEEHLLLYRTATTILRLMDIGYIRESSTTQVTLRFKKATQVQVDEVQTLISLIFSQAGRGLRIEKTADPNVLSIIPVVKPRDYQPPKYTLWDVLWRNVVTARRCLTQEQIKIVHMVQIDAEVAEEFLMPRYQAIAPNFVGLTEEEAVALCEYIALTPLIAYRPINPAVPEELEATANIVRSQGLWPGRVLANRYDGFYLTVTKANTSP